MVIVVAPLPASAAVGHRLVMVGVSAFTSSPTVTLVALFADGTPLAVTTTLPEYGVASGSIPVVSTFTVSVIGAPGRTTPELGETVSQGAPCTAAVKGIGAPLV